MLAATPPPSPALADAVRECRWAEVRTIAQAIPRPLSPAMALAAARAERALGNPAKARALLRAAMPNAGEMAAALRLEAAAAAAALGDNPFPYVAPLLSRASPTAHRHAAANFLRGACEELPLPVLHRVWRSQLPRPLRRELAAVVAVRDGNAKEALRAIKKRMSAPTDTRAAQFLSRCPELSPAARETTAEALLAGGEWSQAALVLASLPPPSDAPLRERWAFLRGRTAYRLGEMNQAAGAFQEAFALATTDEGRFAAAVQRARVAEIGGEFAAAVSLWDEARAAAPAEVEGWDGGARMRLALGRGAEALELLRRSPPTVLQVAGPRLTAALLARGDLTLAHTALECMPKTSGVVRTLWVALYTATGQFDLARIRAAALLADPHGGEWRELVLDLLPPPETETSDPIPASRDVRELAALAVRRGVAVAREAVAQALAVDPDWAPLLAAGDASQPKSWRGVAQQLVAVGLEGDAAALYPHAFPAASPTELAWSAARLAAWGNRPASLAAGERLWARLGPLPAVLLPDAVLAAILPPGLVAGCAVAAGAEAVPASWLVGVVRQESRFDDAAISTAGAIGVAQFIPEVARRLGVDRAELRVGDHALGLAAREVARLRACFGLRLAVVAAAYNAGDTVVATWLASFGRGADEALFTAAIPYRETATYVLAVREGANLARYLETGLREDAPEPERK